MNFSIRTADLSDVHWTEAISALYIDSAQARGTGIATRSAAYIEEKIKKGNAVIAFQKDELAGFCYIETFSADQYVSNSGLIVVPKFRGQGLAKQIKEIVFHHAREKYPKARVFGITTSPVVMHINYELGYKPVSFKELTDDDEFWKGCSSCKNYDILLRNDYKLCLCTSMIAPSKEEKPIIDLSNLIIPK
jgi:N-acetylglutamate synthase-like GNAT family acetyltransferase